MRQKNLHTYENMRKAVLPSLILFAVIRIPTASAFQAFVVEDFEGYEVDGLPYFWKVPDRSSRSLRPLPPDHAKPNDFVRVVMEETGKVLRAYTQGESVQVALQQGNGLEWDLSYAPRLRWRWRADKLPEGAMENSSRLNDTGAALYVSFGCNDWIGRPCTIKYSYSSTLPKGTRARYGKLHVLVVSTALEAKGEWIEVERNVVEDYRMLFGKEPPVSPLYIMIWSDSDNTDGEADVYFDDIVVLTGE
ncbi:MAG: DUF3047 domain-containing protein [Bacteroidetes bacterium]|nr:DUF3047 domain-containing protein [Bacteroidota bacterium]MCY4206265.1 DUF3047 domain-containing protein [Bacteroidota bacterium]